MQKIRTVFTGIVFALLFLSACHSQRPQETANHSTNADPYSWDFGRVEEGRILKHSFILKNNSDKILNIKEVSTSCGCTVSKVKKKKLLSGESTIIEAQFKTKGYFGSTQQYLYVHSDDIDNPVIRFIIKADIIKSTENK